MMRSLITTILLIGASLLTIFYIRPQWAGFNLARQEVEKLNSISTELDDIVAKRDSLLQAINTISKDDLARIDQALPQGPHAADFLVVLEQVVLHHGLILKRIDVSSLSNSTTGTKKPTDAPTTGAIALGDKPKAAINEFPITLMVSGTYESLKEFLQNTENLLRITNITNISFSSAERKNTFDFTLHGKTFYQ